MACSRLRTNEQRRRPRWLRRAVQLMIIATALFSSAVCPSNAGGFGGDSGPPDSETVGVNVSDGSSEPGGLAGGRHPRARPTPEQIMRWQAMEDRRRTLLAAYDVCIQNGGDRLECLAIFDRLGAPGTGGAPG